MITVSGRGPLPSLWMIVGEAPGRFEAELGQPFVGPSGREQDLYLSRYSLSTQSAYLTNIVKEYLPDNPDPTPEQISYWTPTLLSEIQQCQPKLILSVGRFSSRWFLGEGIDMDLIHGIPHKAGAFDSTRSNRAPMDCTILPIIHPAAGLYDVNLKAVIGWDYSQAAECLSLIKSGKQPNYRADTWAGQESYQDVTGSELAAWLWPTPRHENPDILGLDTEGIPSRPWSIQVSLSAGMGWTLRCSQPDFQVGISALQSLANSGTIIVTHQASTPSGCMYDNRMCRAMGLELKNANIWDTMYAAYLLRLESQSLKTLAYRWCGMVMEDYDKIIGDIARSKQIRYLESILSYSWPKPESRIVFNNDGTSKIYTPNKIERTVERILSDIYTEKTNKDGELTDPYSRWLGIDSILRNQITNLLGPIPTATLDDIDLSKAIHYSSRDSDATLRLYYALSNEHDKRDNLDHFLRRKNNLPLVTQKLSTLQSTSSHTLPIFEEMQSNGMPANRSHFLQLEFSLNTKLDQLQSKISHRYWNGQPFNPKSPPQVASLLRRRGLTSSKRTETGALSTGKKSIEHLRYKDEAIADIFDWREHQHIRDMFCRDVLSRIPEHCEYYDISPKLKVTRVHTRRLASEDPNLLAVPVRSEIGRQIREGYQCREGEVFGAVDLSQIELRVLAHDSKSKFLCDKFLSGADIHTETAMIVFGVSESEVKSHEGKFKYRLPAKTTNFGLIYGEQGQGLSEQLRMEGLEGWTPDACDKLIKEIIKLFDIAGYIKSLVSETKILGYMRDYWGMYRYLPGIYDRDPKISAEAGRQAVSQRIQGTAQGMIQNSMAWLRFRIRDLQDAGFNIKWRLQIHDELILTFEPDLWDLVRELLIEALTQHCGIKLRVPVLAEGTTAKTWGQLK